MPSTQTQDELLGWWKPEGLPGIEILTAENSPRLWKIYHNTLTICTVTGFSGISDWIHRGRRQISAQGSLMLIDHGELHNTLKITAPGTFWVLMIQPEIVAEMCRDVIGVPMPRWRLFDLRDSEAFRIFKNLHALLVSDSPLLEKQCRLQVALSYLVARYSETSPLPYRHPSKARLRDARDFLNDHFEEAVSLDSLSGIAGVTKSHFCRAFLREFGLSPHQYQLRLRIAEAQRWLAGRMPFSVMDLGFCDPPQFIRKFKEVLGVTPGAYARSIHSKRELLINRV